MLQTMYRRKLLQAFQHMQNWTQNVCKYNRNLRFLFGRYYYHIEVYCNLIFVKFFTTHIVVLCINTWKYGNEIVNPGVTWTHDLRTPCHAPNQLSFRVFKRPVDIFIPLPLHYQHCYRKINWLVSLLSHIDDE